MPRIVLALVLLLVGGTAAPASAAEPGRSTGRYQPLTPVRILDTRVGVGGSQPGAGSTLDLPVAGLGGVPVDGVTAVTLNVTVTQTHGAGYVQVMPTGVGVPGASSNVNVTGPGQTASNLVTVPVGDGGRISFVNVAGGHLIADVQGYFTAATASAEGRYQALTPTRLVDSRDRTGLPAVPPPPVQPTPPPSTQPAPPTPPSPPTHPGDTVNCPDFATWAQANAWFVTYLPYYGDVAGLDRDSDGIPCESLPGAPDAATHRTDARVAVGADRSAAAFDPYPKPAAGEAIGVRLTGAAGIPASGVSAVALTVTATDSDAAGYVQVVPSGGATALGSTSNVNLTGSGQTVANLVIVPVGHDGTVQLYSSSGTDLIVDVVGFFTDATAPVSSAGLFVPVDPDRLTDTRTTSFAEAGSRTDVSPGGSAGIPADGVAAVFLNATATGTAGAGYLQLYPAGRGTPGASSNVNFTGAGQTVATASIGALGDDAQISVYTPTRTHVILDVFGYFTDATHAAPPTAVGDSPLAGLVVAAKSSPIAYDRDAWVHWVDDDGDCQDTRDEVLIAESVTTPVLDAAGCDVVSGTWVDPYTSTTWTVPSDLDVDHVVALKNAHESGGWAWDPATKRAFANDLDRLDHLVAVQDDVNRAKGAWGPEGWRPPAATSWCDYATDWTEIKTAWGLSVTQAEYQALADMLATC